MTTSLFTQSRQNQKIILKQLFDSFNSAHESPTKKQRIEDGLRDYED